MAIAHSKDLKTFLMCVIQRTDEILLHKDGLPFSENLLSDLLTHADLLGNTMQLLQEICYSCNDAKKWNDLVSVFSEIEKEFISLSIDYSHKCTRTTESCDLPVVKVINKEAGRPAYFIPKDVLVELRGLNFSWSKIAKNEKCSTCPDGPLCVALKSMVLLICRNFQ